MVDETSQRVFRAKSDQIWANGQDLCCFHCRKLDILRFPGLPKLILDFFSRSNFEIIDFYERREIQKFAEFVPVHLLPVYAVK